ncbi:MAG: topoisomerase II [Frankiales bacterium]|nr:topoisomerase II [Frankiales bacterium]
MREPCPCGSGRRYKACHGRAAAAPEVRRRSFEGLAGETDWVALREIVPSATAPLTLAPELAARLDGRDVVLATVLPLAWPGLVRTDGRIFVGLQTATSTGDTSRDIADALLRALDTEPGTPVPPGRPGPGPRLQDVLDTAAPLEVTVHEGFDFWLEGSGAEASDEVAASLERANASVVPTARLSGVEAAYWCRIGTKEHLRWTLPQDEEAVLDALARLHARGEDALGEGTRLIGTFRAHGLLVPVWDLAPGTEAPQVEEPAVEFAARLEQALAETGPLDEAARRARAGLANRQVTLR